MRISMRIRSRIMRSITRTICTICTNSISSFTTTTTTTTTTNLLLATSTTLFLLFSNIKLADLATAAPSIH